MVELSLVGIATIIAFTVCVTLIIVDLCGMINNRNKDAVGISILIAGLFGAAGIFYNMVMGG